MSELSFVPLGVGDAFSARWYSSCLLVEASGERILVDCPHPIRKLLCEATSGSVDVGDVSAVVLTHLHADHASGLEGFGYFSRFVLGRRARLVLHPSVRARLWEGHLAAGMEALLDADAESPRDMGLDDYFELQSLDFERPLALGPFRIECRATRHHVPTTALRITAAGRSLGISADTSFDPELVAEVLKVMKDLAAEGRTMLVVTHEMGFARNVSSRVVFLHKGYIEEDGTPAEVFTHPRSERFRQFISKNAH